MKRLILALALLTALSVGCQTEDQVTAPAPAQAEAAFEPLGLVPDWVPPGLRDNPANAMQFIRAYAAYHAGDDDQPTIDASGGLGDDDTPDCDITGMSKCGRIAHDIWKCKNMCGETFYQVELTEGTVCVGWDGRVYSCNGT